VVLKRQQRWIGQQAEDGKSWAKWSDPVHDEGNVVADWKTTERSWTVNRVDRRRQKHQLITATPHRLHITHDYYDVQSTCNKYFKQVRQQDACTTNAGGGGAVKCAIPRPLFTGNIYVTDCMPLSSLLKTIKIIGGVQCRRCITKSSAVAEGPRIEYFAKWLKITQSHSKWHCWVGRVLVPISISLDIRLYVVPFLGYSASKNRVTLKLGVRVVQGHWKWRRSIDHTTFYWSAIVRIVVCIIFKLFDVESSWHSKRSLKVILTGTIRKLGAVSYSPSIITMAVSLTVYEIFNVKV